MLNLFLAILSSALVSVGMRLSEKKVTRDLGMLMVNYIFCTVLSWGYIGFANPAADGFTLASGCFNGVLYLAGFVLLQKNVKINGVVLPATFLKLGLLVSMVVSVVFFGERPGWLQWLGFVLAVAAIILMNYKPGAGKAESTLALVLLLLAGGGGDAMSKVFEELGDPAMSGHFLLYTFFVAFALCAVLAVRGNGLPGKWEWIFGTIVGVPNFFSAKFLLAALEDLAAVIVYPVYSVATILAVTLTGVLVFREKLEQRRWIALGIILLALVLLNL